MVTNTNPAFVGSDTHRIGGDHFKKKEGKIRHRSWKQLMPVSFTISLPLVITLGWTGVHRNEMESIVLNINLFI